MDLVKECEAGNTIADTEAVTATDTESLTADPPRRKRGRPRKVDQ